MRRQYAGGKGKKPKQIQRKMMQDNTCWEPRGAPTSNKQAADQCQKDTNPKDVIAELYRLQEAEVATGQRVIQVVGKKPEDLVSATFCRPVRFHSVSFLDFHPTWRIVVFVHCGSHTYVAGGMSMDSKLVEYGQNTNR